MTQIYLVFNLHQSDVLTVIKRIIHHVRQRGDLRPGPVYRTKPVTLSSFTPCRLRTMYEHTTQTSRNDENPQDTESSDDELLFVHRFSRGRGVYCSPYFGKSWSTEVGLLVNRLGVLSYFLM